MQLLLILAVLAAMVISEAGPRAPVPGAAHRLALAVAGMMLVALFAQVTSGRIARRLLHEPERSHALLRRFGQLRRVHAVLWLAVAGAILYGLQWGPMVRFNWALDRAILVDDLLVLLPVLAPLVLSWAAFYQVEKAVHARLAGPPAGQAGPCGLGPYLALHARHYLGALLVPLLALLAVQDALELLAPDWTAGAGAAVVHAPLLVLLFLAFPALLKRVWQTAPLPASPLRERLEGLSRRVGFRARDILVWNTHGLVVNAAVTGFTPLWRYVFLSDGLLERLDAGEIEAVFGHELGHVRHGHVPLRLGAMLAPLSAWLLAAQAAPETAARLQAWLGAAPPSMKAPLGLLLLGALGAYLFVVFGWYSRLLECQADLFACRAVAGGAPDRGGEETAGSPHPRPLSREREREDLREAAEVVAEALEKLARAGGADRDRGGWQHASVARRVDLLRRAAADDGFARRFQRRMTFLAGLLGAAVASPAVYYLLSR